MTALDVMCYLERLKVQLTLTPELELRYRAPRGVMTHVAGHPQTCKGPLVQLLTGKAAPLPKGVSLPETDYRQFLTWQTAKSLRVRSSWQAPPRAAVPRRSQPAGDGERPAVPHAGLSADDHVQQWATRESVLHMDRALCGVPRAGEGCVEDFQERGTGS